MGCQGIEVQIEAITSEERQAVRSQDLSQGVDEQMRHLLRAGTEMKHRNNLREGIDCQPQPQHLCGAAQPRAQFVQLEVWDLEVVEAALV